jgi:protein phosphatase
MEASQKTKGKPEEAPPRPGPPGVKVIYEEEADVEEVTSPHARILISANAASDPGKRRPRNEDSLLVLPERSLFGVADGMGGYQGGDVASALAVDTIRWAFENNVFEGRTASDASVPRRGRELVCAIQMANQAVLRRAKDAPSLKNMGTTVIMARFSPNKQRVYIGHVGDSRCYRLRGGTLRQLTTDHTLRELGVRGPTSRQLFQAVGLSPTITIDLVVDKPRPKDIYLLCSDGLSKMVPDEPVREILMGEPDLEAAVHTLVETANAQGGRDNITVVLVKIMERGASQLAALS